MHGRKALAYALYLLTGRFAWRKPGTGILAGDEGLIIETDRPTLPSLLKQAGYATAVVGKWHLGLGAGKTDFNGDIKPGPLECGFDYSFLIPATDDRVSCVYVENHRVVNLDPADPITGNYKNKVGTDPTGREQPDWKRIGTSLSSSIFRRMISMSRNFRMPCSRVRARSAHLAMWCNSSTGRWGKSWPRSTCADLVLQNNEQSPLALRKGEWKLIEPSKHKSGQTAIPMLFNLATDPGETDNLAASQPDKLREMTARLEEIRSAMQSRPSKKSMRGKPLFILVTPSADMTEIEKGLWCSTFTATRIILQPYQSSLYG